MNWLSTLINVVPRIIGAISKSVTAWNDGKKKPEPVNELTFKDVLNQQQQIKNSARKF